MEFDQMLMSDDFPSFTSLLLDNNNPTHQTPINGFLDYTNNANSFSIGGFEGFSSSSSSNSSRNEQNSYFPVFPTAPPPLGVDPIQDPVRGFPPPTNNTHNRHFHDHCKIFTQTRNNEIILNDNSLSLVAGQFPIGGGGGSDSLKFFGGGLPSQQNDKLPFQDPLPKGINEDKMKIDQEVEKNRDKEDETFMMKKKKKKKKKRAKRSLVKGQWTLEEDNYLAQLVEEHGGKCWSLIAIILGGRAGKQCRERWHNHLKPDIKKDAWTEEEDLLLIKVHKEVGNKWAKIADRIPGRTENSIKNHWNATKRRQTGTTRRSNRGPEPSASSAALKEYIHSITYGSPPPAVEITPPPAPANWTDGSAGSFVVAGNGIGSSSSAAPVVDMYGLGGLSEPPFLFGDGGFGSGMEMPGLSFGNGGGMNPFGMGIGGYNGGVDVPAMGGGGEFGMEIDGYNGGVDGPAMVMPGGGGGEEGRPMDLLDILFFFW